MVMEENTTTHCLMNLLKLNYSLKSLLLGEGNGNPLQYSYLEKSMGRGVWGAEVHEIT